MANIYHTVQSSTLYQRLYCKQFINKLDYYHTEHNHMLAHIFEGLDPNTRTHPHNKI
jgi:hypothetical protein